MTRGRGAKRLKQGTLPFRQVGGPRKGAGRPPKGDVAGVSHATRAKLASRFPAHVILKVMRGLPRLRSKAEYATLRRAFVAGCDRFGFRLVHYAVLDAHLHFLVEAPERARLSRGIEGHEFRSGKATH